MAAALCTRSGAVVISRQFLPVTRQRIETLLSQFPRLLQSGQQHTFVETEEVRFVYQPLEAHYLVLVTSKASNILQDMETLRLLTRVVGEHVGPAEEQERMGFVAVEILLAFDEVVSCGWREAVNMSQLQTILAMESQEEIIQDIISKVLFHLVPLSFPYHTVCQIYRTRCKRPKRQPNARLNRSNWTRRRPLDATRQAKWDIRDTLLLLPDPRQDV